MSLRRRGRCIREHPPDDCSLLPAAARFGYSSSDAVPDKVMFTPHQRKGSSDELCTTPLPSESHLTGKRCHAPSVPRAHPMRPSQEPPMATARGLMLLSTGKFRAAMNETGPCAPLAREHDTRQPQPPEPMPHHVLLLHNRLLIGGHHHRGLHPLTETRSEAFFGI
jgi:hypothetical protein